MMHQPKERLSEIQSFDASFDSSRLKYIGIRSGLAQDVLRRGNQETPALLRMYSSAAKVRESRRHPAM
jgi:hypothetical protein